MAQTKSPSSGKNLQYPTSAINTAAAPKAPFMLSAKAAQLILIVCTIIVYVNTLWNGYAIDDGIVITENKLTQQGFTGIKDLMTHDAFYGCLGEQADQLVQGGRYRPLSLVSFAVEYQFLGLNPGVSHAINVLLFTLCVLTLFSVLKNLQQSIQPNAVDNNWAWPFWASLLFAVHPIHTEVVANIKGRDEIMALLGALCSFSFAMKYVQQQKIKWLFASAFAYFLALLSKENSITFLTIIPLAYYFFTEAKAKQYGYTLIALLLPAALFLIMRSQFAATKLDSVSTEILNNPFLLANTSEKMGTLLHTYLQYFKLLLLPFQLSHDYYFNQIPYQSFFSTSSLVSLLIHAGIAYYVYKNWQKKKLVVFGILFYFISFSVVSNLFFSVGILMNERFVFISSVGFCMIAALLLEHYSTQNNPKNAVLFLLLLLIPYSAKTINRNTAWENNLSLLAADVENSPNSAKVHASYAGILYEESQKTEDTVQQNEYLSLAYQHGTEALSIYPNYSDALQIMGNILYRYKKDYAGALAHYQKAYEMNGQNNAKLMRNMGMAYLRAKDAQNALTFLTSSEALLPGSYATAYSLGEAFDLLQKPDSALFWYEKSIKLQPKDGIGYYKIGLVYARQLQQLDKGIEYLQKASALEPKNVVYLEDLAVAQGISGNPDLAIELANKILQINPSYLPAFRILSASYLKKGNQSLSDEYLKKANGQ